MPWLGCSAILNPVTLAEVRDLCGFNSSIHIQCTSIDRPDIKFIIQPIQYLVDSCRDLGFLIEPVRAAVEQVVKEKRENMAREALKVGGMVAAQAVLTSTRHQRKS